jgi:hypothetical protein
MHNRNLSIRNMGVCIMRIGSAMRRPTRMRDPDLTTKVLGLIGQVGNTRSGSGSLNRMTRLLTINHGKTARIITPIL